jgi:20S proteasome alpha/beta subunit
MQLLPPLLSLITNISQPRDDVYGPYNHAFLQSNQPNQHTQSPAVTGTSVVAIKYKDGVVIAADNLGTFHTHRFSWSLKDI